MEQGKLIVIDGIDGSGKATQTKFLAEKLRAEGRTVETLDFPQYTQNFFGGMVRRYLDGEFGPATEVNPYLASLLYAADRWESSQKLFSWLSEGKIVILDRYYTSNLIHQSTKIDLPKLKEYIDWEKKLEFEIFKIPRPNLVVYLHVDCEQAHELIGQRGEGFDGHDHLKHMKRAEEMCLYLAGELGWKTIECSHKGKIREINEIAEAVYHEVKNII